MKNIAKYFFLPTLSLFLLSACTNPLSKFMSDDSVSVEPEETLAEDMSDAEVADEAQDEAGADMDDDSELPEEASFYLDKTIDCSLMKDPIVKKECEYGVAVLVSSYVQDEALRFFDVSLCDQLPTQFMEDCRSSVEETGVKGPITLEEVLALNDALKVVDIVYAVEEGEEIPEDFSPEFTYDRSKCAVLTTPGLSKYCEDQINKTEELPLLNDIIESGSADKCEILKTDKYKNECISYFTPEPIEEDVYEEEIIDNEEGADAGL